MWSMQRHLLYPGAWIDHPVAPAPSAQVQRWTMELTDEPGQTVEAWLMPGRGATSQTPGPAVIFLHGNGELIDHWAEELTWYTDRGVTVLLPEYRGYGRSGGSPSQSRITDDLTAWVQRLTQLEAVDPGRLIYHGRSLGGGFAAQLVLRHEPPPAALILASTFTSLADAAHDLVRMPRWLVRDPLPVLPILRDYLGPTLILHGEADEVVPVAHAKANAAAARDPTLVLYPHAGHNTMPQGHGNRRDLQTFLHQHNLLPYPEANASSGF